MRSTVYRWALRGQRDRQLFALLEDTEAGARFEQVPLPPHPARALAAEDLHFFVERSGGRETRLPIYRLYFRADWDLSRAGAERFRSALEQANARRREKLLLERGFATQLSAMGVVETRDIASPGTSSGLQLGRFISVLVVSLLMVGGSVVAGDSLAGEKERGTLETLLTTAVRRGSLVAAKQLSILAVAVGITVVQLLVLWFWTGSGLLQVPSGLEQSLTAGLLLWLLVLYLPVAALLSSALLLTSAYAKSYKEAQLYFLPLFLLALAPTLAAVVPGVELRSPLALVPIANVSLAVKGILSGDPDVPLIVLSWLVTAAAALVSVLACARLLTVESLLSPVQAESAVGLSGRARFRRDVLRWTAVLWVAVLMGSFLLGEQAALERQLGLNFSVLTGGALLLLARYRLAPRRALFLKKPPAVAWVAALVGAPSGLVVVSALAERASRFLPVPEEALRQLQELLVPGDAPFWKLALLLVVLPAVVEEIFFRGVLLSGLENLRAPLRVVLTALAFGLFHGSFFRLLPTALLGALLALATLATGSIFPAMLWHGLHNGLGLVLIDEEAAGPGRLLLAAGLLGLTLSLWLLRRARQTR